MEDIAWQDPFKKESSSNSFANKFIGIGSGRREDSPNGKNMQASFSDRYLKNSQTNRETPHGDQGFQNDDYRQINPADRNNFQQNHFAGSDAYRDRESVKRETVPVYESNEIYRGDRIPISDWSFLDLKNKKQTGDLYKKILNFNKKSDGKAFCFTSSRGREGVSTILVNLVDYIRQQATDKTILVIDANFQNPSLNSTFNIPHKSLGIVDIFSNRIGVREVIRPISQNIFFLPCGNVVNNKSGNLEPDNFVTLLNECKQLVDYVLIDCPPVLSSSDSLSIAPAADISFFIVQSVKVQRPVAQKAISVLQDNECELGGVILNRVQQVIPGWVYKFI